MYFVSSPLHMLFFSGVQLSRNSIFQNMASLWGQISMLKRLYPFNQISMSNLKEREPKKISTELRLHFDINFGGNAILAKFYLILTRSKSGWLFCKANFDVEIWSKSSRNGRKYFDQNLLKLTSIHYSCTAPGTCVSFFFLLLKNFSIFLVF